MTKRAETDDMRRRRGGMDLVVVVPMLLALSCSGCTFIEQQQGDVPPVPPRPVQSPRPNQPPVVWVGGTLSAITDDELEVRDSSGSTVRVKRLGQGATAFFRTSGEGWEEVAAGESVSRGQDACIETLLDRSNLFALRVFLGATCGPA